MKTLNTYLVLLRGINVGGKNKVPMAELKKCLEKLGYVDVMTYIASGNVILDTDQAAIAVKAQIESTLTQSFKLDSELIKVLILTPQQLRDVIADKPKGFGEEPNKYHSDAIFLIDITVDDAMPVFKPREGVDKVWPGKGVVYSQRLSAERTKSRLSKIMASPLYKSMTIRSWNTTLKLHDLITARQSQKG